MRRIPASLRLVLCSIALASCSGGDDGPDLATIQVTPNPVALLQQETSQLQASVLNTDGQLVTGVAVTFSSSDAAVATVSNTGLVAAGRAGTASIVVKGSGLTTTVPVTVGAVSNSIVVTPNPRVVPQNGTLQLIVVVYDLSGLPIPGAPLTFTSGNTSLATVSAGGLVDPVGPAGEVAISISSGTLSTTVLVTINAVAASLDVTPNNVRIGRNGTVQLTTVVRDFAGEPMPAASPVYESSNISLATVSASGVIQGKGAAGTLQVRVTAAGLATEIPVTLLEINGPEGILEGTSPIVGSAYGIDVSSTGTIVVTGSGTSRATMTNRAFTAIVPVGVSGYQYSPAIALSGNSAWISGLPDASISEINATTGTVLGTVTGLTCCYNFFVLRMSADGSRVYAAGSGRFVVVDPSTRTVLTDIGTASQGLSLALNPAGSTVFVGGYGSIEEITPATGTSRVVTTQENTNFAISPDGQRLYLVSENNGVIKEVRVSDGAVLRSIPVACAGWGIAISPDGSVLIDSCGGQVIIVETATGTVLKTLDVGGATRRTAFSPDGRTALVTNAELGVHFIR